MTLSGQNSKQCVRNHSFDDICNVTEHNKALIASHLSDPVTGVKLYKESYSKEKVLTQ